jgi:hypothetical protein
MIRIAVMLSLLSALAQAQTVMPGAQATALQDNMGTGENELLLASVITSAGKPAECVSPLAVTRIDGVEVVVSHKRFDIEPGLHRLNGITSMNMENCQALGSTDTLEIDDLEAEFEAGMTYFVGFDHSDADITEWKLVIWQEGVEAQSGLPGSGIFGSGLIDSSPPESGSDVFANPRD